MVDCPSSQNDLAAHAIGSIISGPKNGSRKHLDKIYTRNRSRAILGTDRLSLTDVVTLTHLLNYHPTVFTDPFDKVNRSF